MSEILGYDSNGRPLRAGDLVVGASARRGMSEQAWIHLWVPFCVTGPALDGDPGYLNTDVRCRDESNPYPTLKVEAKRVRRIDEPRKPACWKDVCRLTGWQPEKEGVAA